MALRPVSQILLEDHNSALRPGQKGDCPFCGHDTFSVKGDDTLGKCFHPSCGRFITQSHQGGQSQHGLGRALEAVYQEWHAELLGLNSGTQNAYTYLRDDRGIHPDVITAAMLGAVPSGCDVMKHFKPVIDDAEAAVAALRSQKSGRPTKQVIQAEKRVADLQDAAQKLHTCLSHHAGWLAFFYTDATYQCVAVRLRKPYDKAFVSFKPGSAGLFGRELFTPFTSATNQALNDFLLVVEGEVNALQLQSLTVRYEEATGQTLGYIHACAVGSVTTADVKTLRRVAQHPVVCYDNDTYGAGFELVRSVQRLMPTEACTTPADDSDLDSYIREFGQDDVGAWNGVKGVITGRQPFGRTYTGTGEEFFGFPVTGGKSVFQPKLLADALMEQDHYRFTEPALWVYKDGVYVPEAGMIRTACLRLLGAEWTERRAKEAITYTQDAQRLAAWHEDQPRYLNLRNGLYDLTTNELYPHTPTHFSVVQLPILYDPDATCPAILAWLREATGNDDHLVEVLRAYLKAIVKGETTIHRVLELVGPGGTGKGTFLRLSQALVGHDNTFVTELKHLESRPFELANLRFKRLICITDADKYGGSIENLKAITGGDALRMEEKYIQTQQHRAADGLVIIAANEEVQSSDYTSGLGRRRLTIYFTHVPDTPRDLLSIHGATFHGEFVAELPGLLNWILALPDDTMHELLSLHTQRTTQSLRANWVKTLLATNPLAEWANRQIILADDVVVNVGVARKIGIATTEQSGMSLARTTTSESHYEREDDWLYPSYAAHIDLTGGKRLALKRFATLLHDLLVSQLQLGNVRHTDDRDGSRFHGVRLRTADDDATGVPFLVESAVARMNPASVTDVTADDNSVTPETRAGDGCDGSDSSFINPLEKINKNADVFI